MKRLLRSIFEISAMLSLALSLSLVGLWIYTHFHPIQFLKIGDSWASRIVIVDGSMVRQHTDYIGFTDTLQKDGTYVHKENPRPPTPSELVQEFSLDPCRENSATLFCRTSYLLEPPDTESFDGIVHFGTTCYDDVTQMHLVVLIELATILPAVWLLLILRTKRCPRGQCVPREDAKTRVKICVICGRSMRGSPHAFGRFTLKLLACASSILFLLVAQFWLRSMWVHDNFEWDRGYTQWNIFSFRGRLCLLRTTLINYDSPFDVSFSDNIDSHDPIAHWIGFETENIPLSEDDGIGSGSGPAGAPATSPADPSTQPQTAGPENDSVWKSSASDQYWHVQRLYFPYWPIFLATATLTFFGMRSIWRRRRIRRRFAKGLCWNCGYDLRASPERCPECGVAVPKPRYNTLL